MQYGQTRPILGQLTGFSRTEILFFKGVRITDYSIIQFEMKRKQVFQVVELVLPVEICPKSAEINFEIMTPLENYKASIEKIMDIDLYGRRLVFKFRGQTIRYVRDIEKLICQDEDLGNPTFDVECEDFGDM